MDIQFTHNGRKAVVQFPVGYSDESALDEMKQHYPDAQWVFTVADHRIDDTVGTFAVRAGYGAVYYAEGEG